MISHSISYEKIFAIDRTADSVMVMATMIVQCADAKILSHAKCNAIVTRFVFLVLKSSEENDTNENR